MPTPLVSVIVPNYCHAKFLSQRLDSIFSQSYKNYEVIILDDASPDNGASREVIEQYRTNEHVSHIVYNEKNSGSTFVQWQKGINLANGDLIWIAESDDYCCSTLLEELIKAYNRQENCVLAYSSLIVVDENGKTLFRRRKFNNQYYSGEEYLKRYLSLGCFVQNASCAVFSKKAALSISQDYTTLKSAGDYIFWVLVLPVFRQVS